MTTSTIGALSVKITSDTSGLKTGIKQAETLLIKGRKTLNDNAAAFAKWGAAGVAASAAIGAAIFKTQAATIDQLAKTSDKLGIATEKLAGLRLAAEQTGVSSQTMDMALQRMTRRLSEAASGGGEAVKAIDELGLSAVDLANKSPDEALKTIADALEGVENQSDKVRLAFKFFDSEGVSLVNTLNGGSEALEGFQTKAEQLGIALSRVEAAKVEQANDALNEASKLVSGVLQQATIEIAPIVTALAKSFTDAGVEAGGMSRQISSAFNNVIDAIGFAMDAVEGVDRVFQVLGRTVALTVLGIQEGMLHAADFIVNKPVEAVNELIDALNTLPWHNIDPVELSGFGDTIKTELGIVQEAIRLGVDDIAAILAAPMPSTELQKSIAAARIEAQKLAEETAAQKVKKKDDEEEMSPEKALSTETETILSELQKRYTGERELEDQKFAAEQEALVNARLANQITSAEFNALEAEAVKTHQDNINAIKAQAADIDRQQQLRALSSGETLLRLGGKKTEKAVKGLAITQAIIKGKTAAVSAFEAGMSTGGPWAPATAALYTAASLVNTGKMIQSIKSGGKSAPRPSGGTPRAAGGAIAGAGASDGGQTQPQQRVDISIGGDSFFSSGQVRQLIEQINEQTGDGVQLNATLGA